MTPSEPPEGLTWQEVYWWRNREGFRQGYCAGRSDKLLGRRSTLAVSSNMPHYSADYALGYRTGQRNTQTLEGI